MNRTFAAAAAFGLASLLPAVPALAAPPMATLPVGTAVTYHMTSQSTTQSGPQSASHSVRFQKASPTSFTVTLDGVPAGTITMANGSVNVPPNLKDALKPFGQISLFLRGAPQPLAPGASWSVNLPVPLEDGTDNVPVTMSVTSLSAAGATIAGTGSNSTSVQPHVREFPTDVSVRTSMTFNASRSLTSATSTVTVVVHTGRRGRTKQLGSSWTISQSP